MSGQAESRADGYWGGYLAGYALLSYFVISRLNTFRDPLLRDELVRQIHVAGIAALPVIAVLAAITGATTVTQVGALVGQDNDLTQRLLFFGLFYEMAPLLTGLVIVARSSAAIASELAVMQVHDEFTALRRMGVPAATYLLLPRVVALALVLPLATIVFQAIAVVSGWLAVVLLQGGQLQDIAGRFLDAASPAMALLSLLKSATMGLTVGVVATYHGSQSGRNTQAISATAMLAVGSGLVTLFLVDIAFAVLAYFFRS
jgi:phospholipid/cholesterol/gamma-HCH transport system permease protein